MTEDVSTVGERIDWLSETYDLSENCARALILSECGYSHSGIASELGVTSGTAKGYLSELESKIAEGVTEALPKSRRYATFPDDTPKSEVEYAGDYIEYDPQFRQRVRPLNKGIALSEIPPELITLSIDA